MRLRGTIVKLIAFVLVCGGFTAYLAVTIGNIALFRDEYELTAVFDDVTGLLPNDNVKVAGVVVGKVHAIDIVDGRARVRFTVDDKTRLPTDTEAAVRWRNLLGQRYVYLYPGDDSTVLRDGDGIGKTRSVIDLGELFNRLGPIVKAIDPQQVNQFLDAVSGALDGNEESLRRAIDDLARLATTLAARDQAIGRLIEDLGELAAAVNSRDAQIRTVLDNLVTISQTFSESTEVLDRAVTELGDVSKNLGPLLQANRAHIDRILENVAVLVQVVQSKLPEIETAVTNLDDVALRLFRVSRYGEWLQQVIPCGKIGNPVVVATDCDPEQSGSSTGDVTPVSAAADDVSGGSAAVLGQLAAAAR